MKCLICGNVINNSRNKCDKCNENIGPSKYKSIFSYSKEDKRYIKNKRNLYKKNNTKVSPSNSDAIIENTKYDMNNAQKTTTSNNNSVTNTSPNNYILRCLVIGLIMCGISLCIQEIDNEIRGLGLPIVFLFGCIFICCACVKKICRSKGLRICLSVILPFIIFFVLPLIGNDVNEGPYILKSIAMEFQEMEIVKILFSLIGVRIMIPCTSTS